MVLAELGKQVAGRWAALLMLPGACYVIAIVVAVLLGHDNALDPRPLATWLDQVAAAPASGRFGTVLIGAMVFTAASAAAGVGASAVAQLVESVWAASGGEPVLRRFARRRSRRWSQAEAEVGAALREFAAAGGAPHAAERLRAVIARRDAICPVPARRPTWIGDRLYAVDERVHDSYHLDLSATWPRLWLMLPDAARAELAEARTGCASAARLTGWGLLYLPLAAVWWPAVLIATGVLLAAHQRARLAVAVQADLVEAAVDLYGRELATQLGIDCPDRLTPEAGAATSALLRKDRNPAR
ncbi:hypothetical protein [Streptomyces tuirus]